MQYSNPHIPEGINTSQQNPLREFAILTGGLLVIVVVVALGLSLLVDHFANRIPFSAEKALTRRFETTTASQEMETYLNTLAQQLAQAQDLPPEFSIKVHYVDADTINAFATLGGNIVMFRGILERLPNENSLAMVLAHEIAHIKHRDPIRGAGRGVVIALALTTVSATLSNAVTDQVLASGGLLTALQFSREQESEADATALESLTRHYGHVDGADALFEVLEKESSSMAPPEFFNSHPGTETRIERIHQFATTLTGPEKIELTPLPPRFSDWFKRKEKKPAGASQRLP